MPSRLLKYFTFLRTLTFLFYCGVSTAHTVDQVFMELSPAKRSFDGVIFIDAGYCLPELRGDLGQKAPNREWLVTLSEQEHTRLQTEATSYLHGVLSFMQDEVTLPYNVTFPDYQTTPYSFMKSLVEKPILRIKVSGKYLPMGGSLQARWEDPFDANLLIQKLWKHENEKYSDLLQISPGDAIDLGVSIPEFWEETHPLKPVKKPDIEITATQKSWWRFVKKGLDHIIPLGLDHILFIIGLFLMSPKWRPLLHQSLTFTVAHSVTLALALAGVITFSGKWVEVLIALSIVYIAVENFFSTSSSWKRILTVFIFGLLHGLGFGSVLSAHLPKEDLLWPLVGFNLGVEIGQILVLTTCFLLFLLTKKYFKWVRRAGSLLIALIGIYWVIERI